MSRLVVHEFGRTDAGAPTLVLLHGYSDSGTSWTDAVERWASNYRIVAPDALGHGRSPRFTYEELAVDPSVAMVQSTVEVLEQVATTGSAAVLIGHSMGGRIAGTVASRRPDLVAGAVLEDPAWISIEVASTPTTDFIAKERLRWSDERALRLAEARQSGWPDSELEEWLIAKANLDPQFGARGQIASPLPWQAELRALTVSTLIVTGDRDVILTTTMLEEVRSLMPEQARIAVVPRAGHGVRRENRAGYHAVVDAFLAQTFR